MKPIIAAISAFISFFGACEGVPELGLPAHASAGYAKATFKSNPESGLEARISIYDSRTALIGHTLIIINRHGTPFVVDTVLGMQGGAPSAAGRNDSLKFVRALLSAARLQTHAAEVSKCLFEGAAVCMPNFGPVDRSFVLKFAALVDKANNVVNIELEDLDLEIYLPSTREVSTKSDGEPAIPTTEKEKKENFVYAADRALSFVAGLGHSRCPENDLAAAAVGLATAFFTASPQLGSSAAAAAHGVASCSNSDQGRAKEFEMEIERVNDALRGITLGNIAAAEARAAADDIEINHVFVGQSGSDNGAAVPWGAPVTLAVDGSGLMFAVAFVSGAGQDYRIPLHVNASGTRAEAVLAGMPPGAYLATLIAVSKAGASVKNTAEIEVR